ncbi:hypothetical protein O6P43_021854 [Quillaja saponaria]|uniref:Uncharacterized protein n=1 Tax=Quillaja saponaria TaxID=32244 RepID=A0AAD7PHF4_QUISA|nr:hypothetical protein O6P43_021854 [Quillaja saponaria]
MEASTNKSREQLESRHILIEHPQANEDFVSSIKEKMKDISSSETIFMVPEKLRTGNEKVYIPDKVSIGPLHHGISTLTAMEDHKWRYLYALLSRKPNLEGILDGCVKALRELEQRARKCYAKEFDQLTADQFVEMMLVDGCFIIELLCKYVVKGLRCRNDPIFTTPGMLLSIRNMLPCDEEVVNEKISQEGNHLLDLISHFYLPSYPREQVKQSGSSEVIECAKMLQEAGIRFRKVTAKSVLDIMFFDGVIEIPPLKIYRFSEVLFANLIALEQHNCDMQYVTSYAFLMSALIRSDKDARLLRRHRILISNEYKDIKDVYESFQKYKWEEVNVKDLYYAGLFEQINDQYRRRNWSAWLGNLKHKLCHS